MVHQCSVRASVPYVPLATRRPYNGVYKPEADKVFSSFARDENERLETFGCGQPGACLVCVVPLGRIQCRSALREAFRWLCVES